MGRHALHTIALHRHVTACTDVRYDVTHMCLSRARAQATGTLARARARPALTDAPARRIDAWYFFLPLPSPRVCVSRRVITRSRNAQVSVQVARGWVDSRARIRLRQRRVPPHICVARRRAPRRASGGIIERARGTGGWDGRSRAKVARARDGSTGARAWSRLGIATTCRAAARTSRVGAPQTATDRRQPRPPLPRVSGERRLAARHPGAPGRQRRQGGGGRRR